MVDEMTPSEEVEQNQAPVESVVVEEVVTPVVETPATVEAPIESTAQTLNPTEVGSGEVGALNPDVSVSGTEVAKALPKNGIRELLVKAQSVIQFRKRKKLDQIMNLFAKRTSVTNDEVEKLLHVSDATATRYLSILEKEGKIKQTGKTGKGVLYVRS